MSTLQTTLALAAAMALAGCGGGGASSPNLSTPAAVPASVASTVSTGEHSKLGPTASTTPTIHGHYDRLNEVRVAMGLPGLDWNPNLANAAQSHADYQRLNGQLGHSETVGRPGYTGEGCGARDAASGYAGTLVSEVIIGGQPDTAVDGRNLMDAMLAAPGHRFVLLAYEFSEVGIGSAPLTSNLGSRNPHSAPVDGVLAYPYNGQQGVGLGYAPASEMPNPLPGVSMTGMPISLHAGIFSSFSVNKVSLQNSVTNEPLELIPSDPLGSARSAFVFFPRQVLQANSSYTFSAEVLINGRVRQVRSSFNTGRG